MQPPIMFESSDLYDHMTPEQRCFELKAWYPEAADPTKPTQIAILINGFLEGVDADQRKRNLMRKRYEKIATALNRENIAAVFLPLPFHFDRGGGAAADGTFQAVAQLKKNGTFLYYGGYDQIRDDIEKLVADIHAQPEKYHLTPNPKVHLVGYSLGGAAVLGAAAGLEKKIASLSVLFSTWKIANINVVGFEELFKDKFGFGIQDWKATFQALAEAKREFDPVFRDLVWGDAHGDGLGAGPDRILFVHGMDDEIFPNNMTSESNLELYRKFLQAGDDRECVFISFGGLDHAHFRNRDQVAQYVAHFIANPA